MSHDPHHEHLIDEIAKQFEPVLSKSPQGVYIYLDDEHKICNRKFADMLGYKSVQEWVDNEYPADDIAEEEMDKGVKAYMDASEKFICSTLPATFIKKDGTRIKTEITLVPVPYKNEVFVIHFISEK